MQTTPFGNKLRQAISGNAPCIWLKLFLLLGWGLIFPVEGYSSIGRHNFRIGLVGGMSLIGDYTDAIDDLHVQTGEWFASTIPLPSDIYIAGTSSIEFGYTFVNIDGRRPFTADFSTGVRGISFPQNWKRDSFSFSPYVGGGMGFVVFPSNVMILIDLFYANIGTTHNVKNVHRIGMTAMVGLPLGFRIVLPMGLEIGVRHELELSIYFDGMTIESFTSFPNIAKSGILRYNLLLSIGWFYGREYTGGRRRR